MQVREAKDFLVQQTAQQAQTEGAALSELEKRMMYFTSQTKAPAPLRGSPHLGVNRASSRGRYIGETSEMTGTVTF